MSSRLRQWADRLDQPFCGPAEQQDEIVAWFPDRGQEVASLAVMALRAGNETQSFGLLVIGSHDPNRFQSGMGTVVLEQLPTWPVPRCRGRCRRDRWPERP